ncbi:MAG: transglycosylase domain-containing protein [Actinomycetota bacterium]|nr:transglycosylase domain-containing protein [Actinomycetota bacterium]
MQPTRLDALAERLGSPAAWGRLLLRVVGLVAVMIGAAVLLAASLAPTVSVASTAVNAVDEQVFNFDPLPAELGDPSERSVIYARDGSVLAVLHGLENRRMVPLRRVPEHVQQAVLATEDSEFFRHRGVDWRAVARAAMGNAEAGEIRSGASTITQQLVQNVVLRDRSQTVRRKLREAVLATQLERRLTKRDILGEYLNIAYFGHGVYGIGTAAKYYFDRGVSELTVPQAAVLAGIIRTPAGNDPVDHPRAARIRRNIVLRQMAEQGFLGVRKAERLTAKPLRLRLHGPLKRGDSFFVAYVRHLLRNSTVLGPGTKAREEAVLRGGLRIYTTLDPELQRDAVRSIDAVLPSRGGAQSAVTAVDPRSGEILAIGVGPKRFGKGKDETQVTPAVPGLGSPVGRQPGSAFKPFQLVAALESGLSPTLTYNAGASYKFRRPGCRGYEPGNYADASQGVLDMYDATAVSSNTYFSHLLDLTGPRKLVEVAQRMGVTAKLTPYCSTVLGTNEVFGLDMASGMGTLANGGVHCTPYAISEIRDRHGRTLLRERPRCARAVEAGIAARATDMLRGPIENGTASANVDLDRPAAGKTGTTQNYGNAWFSGYLPQLSVSTWVGDPEGTNALTDARCGGAVTGGCLPTMIWSRFMNRAVSTLDLAAKDFPEPPPLPKGPVPSLVGRHVVDARRLAGAVGFRPTVQMTPSRIRPGIVIGQRPAAGRQAQLGGSIRLLVAKRVATPTRPATPPRRRR